MTNRRRVAAVVSVSAAVVCGVLAGAGAAVAAPAGGAGTCTAPTDSSKVTGGYSATAYCENPFWLAIGDGSTLTDAIASSNALITYANATTIRCDDEAPTKVPGGFQVALTCAKPGNPGPYLGLGATVTAAAHSALTQVSTG